MLQLGLSLTSPQKPSGLVITLDAFTGWPITVVWPTGLQDTGSPQAVTIRIPAKPGSGGATQNVDATLAADDTIAEPAGWDAARDAAGWLVGDTYTITILGAVGVPVPPAPTTHPDVLTWETAVNTADQTALSDSLTLEPAVVAAMHKAVNALAAAGVWSKTKYFAVWSAPRSIEGCAVPVKGDTTTYTNWVSTDLTRGVGLTPTTGLASIRMPLPDATEWPGRKDDHFAASYVVSPASSGSTRYYFGAGRATSAASSTSEVNTSLINSATDLRGLSSTGFTGAATDFAIATGAGATTGLIGVARSDASTAVLFYDGSATAFPGVSSVDDPFLSNYIFAFARGAGSPTNFTPSTQAAFIVADFVDHAVVGPILDTMFSEIAAGVA